jgi:hypothetical protein
MKMTEQQVLFDAPNNWQLEWKGMPEFAQEDLTSHRRVIVHFRNDADVEEFAKLLNQRITLKQPSCWFPKMDNRIASDKRYVDES